MNTLLSMNGMFQIQRASKNKTTQRENYAFGAFGYKKICVEKSIYKTNKTFPILTKVILVKWIFCEQTATPERTKNY